MTGQGGKTAESDCDSVLRALMMNFLDSSPIAQLQSYWLTFNSILLSGQIRLQGLGLYCLTTSGVLTTGVPCSLHTCCPPVKMALVQLSAHFQQHILLDNQAEFIRLMLAYGDR